MIATDKPTTESPLLLDVATVAQLHNVSQRHIWRMCNADQFPRPASLGAKLKHWSRATVLRWIEEQLLTLLVQTLEWAIQDLNL